MKLKDFRERLRRPEPEPRHEHAGRTYTGIDPGFGPDRSVMTTFRREADGSLKLVASGVVNDLHDFRSSGARCDRLSEELIRRDDRVSTYPLGASFMERHVEVTGATWTSNDGIPEDTLGQIMDREPTGRVRSSTGEPSDFLLFCDNAFRQPMLFRYVHAGIVAGRPVVYVAGDASGALHVGHGACFYPAETVPCGACERTGVITEASKRRGAAAPSTRVGATCPTCHGLARIWRARPWPHLECSDMDARTFADANPAKWRRAGTF